MRRLTVVHNRRKRLDLGRGLVLEVAFDLEHGVERAGASGALKVTLTSVVGRGAGLFLDALERRLAAGELGDRERRLTSAPARPCLRIGRA